MNKRTITNIAVGLGAGALVLGMAAPAMAAGENFTNDTLPGKTTLLAGQSATVTLTTPEGYDCTKWVTRKVGQKRANVVVQNTSACNAGVLSYSVSVPGDYTKKANVVVKFIVTNTDATMKQVETLVVKVNPTGKPQTGKPDTNPGKGPKG